MAIYVLSVVDAGVEDWGACYAVFEVVTPETERGDILNWGVNYHDAALYKQTRQRDAIKNFFVACRTKLRTETPTREDMRECIGSIVSARIVGGRNIYEFYRYSPVSGRYKKLKHRRRGILACGLKKFYGVPDDRFAPVEGILFRAAQCSCGLNTRINANEGQILHVAG